MKIQVEVDVDSPDRSLLHMMLMEYPDIDLVLHNVAGDHRILLEGNKSG